MTKRSESLERGGGGGGGEGENKPTKAEFLVSFLVDARGGSMTGSRSTGLRIAIPPRAAEQPVRVTCRQLRVESVLHPPPLSDGEGLATRILQLTPASFLSPVLVEINHSTKESAEREVVILRCDSGKKWSLHTNIKPDNSLNQFLSSSINNVSINKKLEQKIQIITNSLPQYFALISRPRHQTFNLGPEGGLATSNLAPGLQCFFPAKALTKPVCIGISVCAARPSLLSDLSVQGGAVSPVITIEPRRRKFHKAVTVTLPIPQPLQIEKTGEDRERAPIEMSLLLLCSMSDCGSRAVWEDVTLSTPLTYHQGTVQFNTVVSAAFWLVNLPTWMVTDSLSMLDKLFRSLSRVPYLARISVYWREEDGHFSEDRTDGADAELRVLVSTHGERVNDNCLESQEGFKLITTSSDLIIREKSELELKIKGNLGRVSQSGRILFKPFRENRCTVGVKKIQNTAPAAATLEVGTEENILFSTNILIQIKKTAC